MKSFFCAFLLTVNLFLCCATDSSAANRFNVFTYYDYDYNIPGYRIINRDSFYIQLDEMGISHFLTMSPDSAAKYKDMFDLDMSLVTNHWRPGFIIYLDDSNTIPIYHDAVSSICIRMDGQNPDPAFGYKRDISDPLYTGELYFDGGLISRYVLRAVAGQHSAGWLHPRFREGIFHSFNHFRDADPNTKEVNDEELTFEAHLRLLDISGPPSTIVAQLVFDNHDWAYYWEHNCASPNLSPYNVVRYNDTMLIVGTDTGLVIVPTIDRQFDTSKTKRIYFPECGSPVNRKYFDSRNFRNVCYITGSGDTFERAVRNPFLTVRRGGSFRAVTRLPAEGGESRAWVETCGKRSRYPR